MTAHRLCLSSLALLGWVGLGCDSPNPTEPVLPASFEPVRLGPGVNTTDMEQAPMYLQSAEDESTNLYFNRGSNALELSDIYSANRPGSVGNDIWMTTRTSGGDE